MRIGVEIAIVTDALTGKRGLRVWPYMVATPQQYRLMASIIAISAFLTSIVLLTSLEPDPVIKPELVLFP
jgi:hypothetical protein